MTKTEFERQHGVRLVCKRDLWWARLIGYFWADFCWRWWTTMRLPFRRGVIAYPMGVDPMGDQWKHVRRHELVHVRQQKGLGLYWSALLYVCLPLPILFSGRWFVERQAFLVDIAAGALTVDAAVTTLWRYYLFPWPPVLMRIWFEKRRGEQIAAGF